MKQSVTSMDRNRSKSVVSGSSPIKNQPESEDSEEPDEDAAYEDMLNEAIIQSLLE